MSKIVVNGRVKHRVFGNGTITDTNESRTIISFDNNETKAFPTEFLSNMVYFEDADDSFADNIKIEHISVNDLFDRLDYDIDINTENNVAILSAPNGCGKTTIFKLIEFLFNPQFSSFREIKSIPFSSFSCTLNNGKTLTILKEALATVVTKVASNGIPEISYNSIKYDFAFRIFGEAYDLFLKISAGNKEIETASLINAMSPSKKPIDSYFKYAEAQDELEDGDSSTDKGFAGARTGFDVFKKILMKNHCAPQLDFIEANRLQKTYYPKNNRYSKARVYSYDEPRQREPEKIDYINKASEEIAWNINTWLQDYNRKLTDAKNKLPSMYLMVDKERHTDFETFKKRWNRYHLELKKYHEIGLLESTETVIKPSELKDAYENKASFLITYLDAFEGTLEPLQKKYDKLKLFADIFNKRNEITQKTLKFTPTGIKVFSGEKEISLDCLSSGEKNDFVMFYRLIFNTYKYGIVLIDEPEISLHIEWQEEYLDRLLDICKMNNLQAIVATHSPNIVNGHFDLFVDKR